MINAAPQSPINPISPMTSQPSPVLPTAPLDSAAPIPPKKSAGFLKNWKMVAGALALLVLVIGGAAAFVLQQQSQDVRQQAMEVEPGGEGACGQGCAATQKKINGVCQESCTCGSTVSSCLRGLGGTCLNKDQCQAGLDCVAQKCVDPQPTSNPEPVGDPCKNSLGGDWQEPELNCSSGIYVTGNFYKEDTQIAGHFCHRCVAYTPIESGQRCTSGKCICTNGPDEGEYKNAGQTCVSTANLSCYEVLNNSCVLNPNVKFEKSKDTCEDFGFFNTQSACLASLGEVRCFEKQANDCIANNFSKTAPYVDEDGNCNNDNGYYSNQSICLGNKPETTSNKCDNYNYKAYPDPAAAEKADKLRCESSPNYFWDAKTCSCMMNSGTQVGGQTGPCCVNGVYKSLCTASDPGVKLNPKTWGSGEICCKAVSGEYLVTSKSRCSGSEEGSVVNDAFCQGVAHPKNAQDCSSGASAGGTGTTATGAMCVNPPYSPVKKYVKFTCPNGCVYDTDGQGVQAWRCYENMQQSDTPLSLAPGECGQVDEFSGINPDGTADWNSYCGYKPENYNCDQPQCHGGSTPTPTPPVGPMCLNITVSPSAPTAGQSVTFTCGQVSGSNITYQFRVKTPAGTVVTVPALTATANRSQSYLVSESGQYTAQCRICVSGACQSWEDLPGGTRTTGNQTTNTSSNAYADELAKQAAQGSTAAREDAVAAEAGKLDGLQPLPAQSDVSSSDRNTANKSIMSSISSWLGL